MTKKKIAWITDSTAYITPELLENGSVYVVPLTIMFGEEAYEDGVDLTPHELYEKIKASKQIPKTSQPSPGRFMALFERLKEEYEGGIAVHISSQLSNVTDKAKEWKKELEAEYPSIPITVGEISSTIGVHAGEGTIALTWTHI